MCMIDFGCYTNHSLGMSEATDYNKSHYEKGRHYTFVCDRYSVAAFPELDSLSRGINNNLRCGLEIDIAYMDRIIPVKCIAVSERGIENLYRIVGRADRRPLCVEAVNKFRNGILFGFSGGYDVPKIREFADFWYLTPSFYERECREIYDAAVSSGKYLCAATNACYVNKSDEHKYRILQSYEDLGSFKNRSGWNHMLSESEMFKHLDFLGHQTAWEILIDNPWRLLEPYQDFLCREPFPVPFFGKEYLLPFDNSVATVQELAEEKLRQSDYSGNADAKRCLEEELEAMKPYQAERLLVSRNISEYLREKGYRPLNKGWIGASFAAYLSGATNVDPMAHHIPWELYFTSPDPKAYSVRHYIPEAIKSERRKLLEQALPESLVLPCEHEVDIPFPAKAALGAELRDAVYPFTMPSMTHGLFASQEKWCVFPSDFDKDLAKGFATLSPRLLEGHFSVVEIYVDKRIDKIREGAHSKSYPLQCDILSEEQLQKTGKGLSQYAKGSDKIQEIVFSEDFYYKLLASSVPKIDAIRLANDLRKGLFGAEKYRTYTEDFPRRYAHLLVKAGYSEKEIADVLSIIKWLCPKSEAIEEAELNVLTEEKTE